MNASDMRDWTGFDSRKQRFRKVARGQYVRPFPIANHQLEFDIAIGSRRLSISQWMTDYNVSGVTVINGGAVQAATKHPAFMVNPSSSDPTNMPLSQSILIGINLRAKRTKLRWKPFRRARSLPLMPCKRACHPRTIDGAGGSREA